MDFSEKFTAAQGNSIGGRGVKSLVVRAVRSSVWGEKSCATPLLKQAEDSAQQEQETGRFLNTGIERIFDANAN